jgi:hypothetical protein
MSTYKNTSGDYYITCDDGSANLIINAANMEVLGNITYVADLKVNDAFIIVAGNNTGTITSMGMVAQKSNTTYAGLRFNTITSAWEISPSVNLNGVPVSPYLPINTGNATVAGANTQIQFNLDSNFGASANLTFDKTTNHLTINAGYQTLGNVGNTPSSVSNSVSIYNKAVGIGNTGLYVIGSTVDDELISAKKARLYSIIF